VSDVASGCWTRGAAANALVDVAPDRASALPDDACPAILLARARGGDAASTERLGAWLRANGESVYGTRGGPWLPTRAYGSTLDQGSGLPSITGAEGWPPTMNHVAGGDPNGGFNAGAALIAALLHKKRTGRGQLIDLSQVECMFPLAASGLIAQSTTGKAPKRWGNRHPLFVPHGVFRCRGADAWVVIAITTDDAFRRLCKVIGRPDLSDDPRLATAEGRRADEDRIEHAITNWTETQAPDDAMAALQHAGIAAGVARGFNEMITAETHLLARGFWQEIDRPILGKHWQPTTHLPLTWVRKE
jgi:crotonobetainyl-CoA:carnitine CoA-transferase CaiB-like acyl-CoA transferase